MTDYKVQPFKQLHEGREITLYLGVIKADELVDGRADIPRYDAITKTGYQRPPTVSRVNSLARYVIGKEGLLPTAVLVNVRKGAKFTLDNEGLGTLHVPDGEKLWIMDGQHRYKGLQTAQERKQPLHYDVPIVFTLDFDEDGEGRVFYVVNHEQKSVSTDLINRLHANAIAARVQAGLDRDDPKKKVSPTDLRKLAAVNLTDALAERRGGPWFGRISLPDEVPNAKTKPIRYAVFIGSLQHFLKDRWAVGQIEIGDIKRLTDVVEVYWRAIASLMPEAFADHTAYAVQKPLGAYVFNGLLPDIVFLADRAQDFSEKFFRRELEKLGEWAEAEQWRWKDGPEPLVSTNSQYAVHHILGLLRPTYISTPGLAEAVDAS